MKNWGKVIEVAGCMLSIPSTSPCFVAFSTTTGFMMLVSFPIAGCMLSTSSTSPCWIETP